MTEHEIADTLLLAGNELTTNTVLHARTEFTVRVVRQPDVVRVEVSDGNTRLPQPCLAPSDATTGRGLQLVDGSGLQWGVDRHSGGKTVWQKLPAHPRPSATPPWNDPAADVTQRGARLTMTRRYWFGRRPAGYGDGLQSAILRATRGTLLGVSAAPLRVDHTICARPTR